MPIGSHGRATSAPNVFVREFDGECVLLDLSRGDYFGLDEIGARLWSGLMRGRTPYEVAQEVAGAYEVELPRLVDDLTRLADEMASRGLLLSVTTDTSSGP